VCRYVYNIIHNYRQHVSILFFFKVFFCFFFLLRKTWVKMNLIRWNVDNKCLYIKDKSILNNLNKMKSFFLLKFPNKKYYESCITIVTMGVFYNYTSIEKKKTTFVLFIAIQFFFVIIYDVLWLLFFDHHWYSRKKKHLLELLIYFINKNII
jgi:hypothetical protein